MPWTQLTATLVRELLSAPELSAIQTAALATGQADPLPGVCEQTAAEVRGYVAAHAANTLSDNVLEVPGNLTRATLALVRNRLASRLPVASLVTEQRRREYEDAIQLLRDVAAGRYAVDVPSNPSTNPEAPAAPRPRITARDTSTLY